MAANVGWIAEILSDLSEVARRDGCHALSDALLLAERVAVAEAVLRREGSPRPPERPAFRRGPVLRLVR